MRHGRVLFMIPSGTWIQMWSRVLVGITHVIHKLELGISISFDYVLLARITPPFLIRILVSRQC
jgi:hypothetical protein